MREEYWKEETEKMISKISGFELLDLTLDRVEIKCKCGKIRIDKPYNFLKYPRCECGYPKNKMSTPNKEFKKRILDLRNGEYQSIGFYLKRKGKVLMKHVKCGYEWMVQVKSFIDNGNQCPKCNGKAKRTNSEFKNEIKELTGDEYIFLEKYQGVMQPILCYHKTCGHTWKVAPQGFINSNSRCPICSRRKQGLKLRKTHAELIQELKDKNIPLKPLEKYNKSNIEIKFKCLKCNNVITSTPSMILLGKYSCDGCKKKIKLKNKLKQLKEYHRKLSDIFGLGGYEILDYNFIYGNDNNTKIKIKIKKCNHVNEFRIEHIIDKGVCLECAREERIKNECKTKTIEFENKLKELTNGKYELIKGYKFEEYVKHKYSYSLYPVFVRHNECGYEYTTRYNDFVNAGHRCPKCNCGNPRNIKDIKQEISDLVGDEFTVISDKRMDNGNIILKHNKCGKSREIDPSYFITHRQSCNYCFGSEQERILYNYLEKNNYSFEYQYKADSDKDILRRSDFDFKVNIDKDNFVLVELDGKHHYENIFNKDFDRRIEIDRTKTEYCKKNNISLIRIPYWQFDELTETFELKMQHLDLCDNEIILQGQYSIF